MLLAISIIALSSCYYHSCPVGEIDESLAGSVVLPYFYHIRVNGLYDTVVFSHDSNQYDFIDISKSADNCISMTVGLALADTIRLTFPSVHLDGERFNVTINQDRVSAETTVDYWKTSEVNDFSVKGWMRNSEKITSVVNGPSPSSLECELAIDGALYGKKLSFTISGIEAMSSK